MEGEDTAGEVNLLLKDIKQMSEDIMNDLRKVDQKLAAVQERALGEGIQALELVHQLKDTRLMIGNMEKEEEQELEIEAATETVLAKLRQLIDKCIR
jgi:hypothetical protein